MVHGLSLLIALAFGAPLSGCTPGPASSPLGPGEPLPAVQMTTLTGTKSDVAHLAQGRVVLVSLWATWCEACRGEMDALNRLDASTSQGQDALVLGVDVGEEPADVAAFARSHELRYAQLVDADFSFADALGQRHVPATIVIDRQGRIVFRGDALDARGLVAFRHAISAGQSASRSEYPSGATAR